RGVLAVVPPRGFSAGVAGLRRAEQEIRQMTTAGQSFAVRSACVVEQLLPDSGRVGVTAMDKRAGDGPRPVREHGVDGAVQADREHRGGPWKAVYPLSDSAVAPWSGAFGGPIPPGYFGENLRLDDVDTSRLVSGTGLRVGSAGPTLD